MTRISCLEAWHVPDAWAFRRGVFDESGDRGDRSGHHWWVIIATAGIEETTHVVAAVKQTGQGWRGRVSGSPRQVRTRAPCVDRAATGRPVFLPFLDVPLPPIPVDEFLAAPARRDPRKDVAPSFCPAIRDAIMASPPGAWGAVQRRWRPSADGRRRCPGCAACDEASAGDA